MTRPNILIVMTDHQRADTVLSEHPAVTPNLDKFADEAVTFTETYCPSPHCCPSRATFHSGLLPIQHGVWNNVANCYAQSTGPAEGVRLWSEDLAAAGYDMPFAGKWHVSSTETPKDRGWRQLSATSVRMRTKADDWARYRETFDKGDTGEGADGKRGEGQILRPGYDTYTMYGARKGTDTDDKVAADGVKALGELAGADKPWAMFLGLHGPHDPYRVPQRFLDLYDIEKIPLPPSYADRMEDKPRIYQRMRQMRWDQLSEREIREGVRHYWAFCSYLDDLFGQVLAALEASGQADNTLVMYCSDHGDYCGDHGLFAKGIPCFRGAYNVPMVVRFPAGVKNPGRRADQFVSLADIGPTFLELAGIATDRSFSGRSIVPLLADTTPPDWPDEMFHMCDGVELYFTQRAVMTKEHKYVYNGFDFDELYDLRADPHEIKNLADDPAYEQIKRDLVRRYWRFAKREGDRVLSRYITISLFPYGPQEIWRD